MATLSIDILRQEFPYISDADVASHYANKYRHVVMLRYKSDPTKEYDNLASCDTDSEVEGYFNSPHCHNVEIVYDRRPKTTFITQEMIIGKKCERCSIHSSQASLNLDGGNDFFICGECTSIFCKECYLYLPRTEGETGYGKCPKCDTSLSRALTETYAIPGGNSLRIIESSNADMERFISETLSNSLYSEIDIETKMHGKSIEWQLGLMSGWPGENVDEVKRLIAEGASINSSNADSYPHGPPLHFASFAGHLDIVKVLLDNGADPNLPNEFHDTPLIAASKEGHFDIVNILLNNGSDINLQGFVGTTPLAEASFAGHLDIVRILLNNGADVQLYGSRYPLVLAAMEGNNEIVIELLAKGAHLGEAGQSGREALLKAIEEGHEKTALLIKEKIDDSNSVASATTRPPKKWWDFWSWKLKEK